MPSNLRAFFHISGTISRMNYGHQYQTIKFSIVSRHADGTRHPLPIPSRQSFKFMTDSEMEIISRLSDLLYLRHPPGRFQISARCWKSCRDRETMTPRIQSPAEKPTRESMQVGKMVGNEVKFMHVRKNLDAKLYFAKLL